MNQRIEHMSVGDVITLKEASRNGKIDFDVLNVRGEKIGKLWTEYAFSLDIQRGLSRMLKNARVSVNSVTPLSARRKGSKYAAMTIRVDYVEPSNKAETKNASPTLGAYTQKRIESWPPVAKIKSIYDAVIGVTDSGEVYIYGFCPCSERELLKLFEFD